MYRAWEGMWGWPGCPAPTVWLSAPPQGAPPSRPHDSPPTTVRAEGHFFLSSFASPGDIASLGLGSLQRRPTFPAHLLGGDQGSPSRHGILWASLSWLGLQGAAGLQAQGSCWWLLGARAFRRAGKCHPPMTGWALTGWGILEAWRGSQAAGARGGGPRPGAMAVWGIERTMS